MSEHQDDEQWRGKLSPEQFNICRGKGTERAFTGKYWDTKETGIYRCACFAGPPPPGLRYCINSASLALEERHEK